MTKIEFLDPSGRSHHVDARDDDSLMQVALSENIPGIVGECGGELSCATCHVYLPAAASAQVPSASADEEDLLELVDHTNERSRLGCQVRAGDLGDGVVVEVAPS